MKDYQLLDSGDGRKWERFGKFILERPCPQAIWRPQGKIVPDASFFREKENKWTYTQKLPPSWQLEIGGILMKIAPTDFGHLGVFPEHASLWKWVQERITKGTKLLNLFAYSGGMTMAAAQKGASLCHVDASKGMVDWARENASLNGLKDAPIRWIVDDVLKFLKREIKRGVTYDGIVLDPPTFGRGSKGEVFKIEKEIQPLLQLCKDLKPSFLVLSSHTPGFTSIVLSNLLGQFFDTSIEAFEMVLESKNTLPIPSGYAARLTNS
ncbi:MAG: hypothetical protein FJZ64_01085 [Chlamydiae bacterium]|nr:hypothetical protein [Chlamydiota bacterium]